MRRWLGSLALGALLLTAGCGQKGPLYLPDKKVRVITTPAAQPAAAQPAAAEPAPPPPAPAPSGAARSASPAPQSAPGSTPPTSPAPPKPTDKNDDSEAVR